MSLKENITMVKEELSTEEQFFEQAVRTERFVKKYKKPLIGLLAAIVVIVIAWAAYDAYEASGRDAANQAYMTLQENPDDAQAQQVLQAKAPLLYDAWRMAAALKKGDAETLRALADSPAPEVADMSAYSAAVLEQSGGDLAGYAYRQNSFFKDMALIDEAVLLIGEGKASEAQRRLKMIDISSPAAPLAEALGHYGIK